MRLFWSFSFILGLIFSWGSLASVRDNGAVVNAAIRGFECRSEVEGLFSRWTPTGDWLSIPSDFKDSKAFASPTREVGVWIRVDVFSDGEIEATKIVSGSYLRATWDEDCHVSFKRNSRELRESDGPGSLSDADLHALLALGSSGLIYAGSSNHPHDNEIMSLAKKVASKLGIRFIAVKQTDSVELEMRGALKRAPSVLVFGRGRLGTVYPIRSANDPDLEATLRKALNE